MKNFPVLLKRLVPTFGLVLLLGTCPGCATGGTKIKASELSAVQDGVTTKNDLIRMFGAPQETTLTTDGREAVIYSWAETQAKPKAIFYEGTAGTPTAEQPVFSVFLLNPNGTVQSRMTGTAKDLYLKIATGRPQAVREAIERDKIALGMLPHEVKMVRGAPSDINRTVTAHGVTEQWVYGSVPFLVFIYIEDGEVTGWQD